MYVVKRNKESKGPHIEHPSTMCQLMWRIHQGGYFVFSIGQKIIKLKEDIEYLHFVKFHQIHSAVPEKHVSANPMSRRSSWFSDRPEKHKLGRGHCVLASCQISSNSVQRLKRSRKCRNQSEVRAVILFFPIDTENTHFLENVEFLIPAKFR